MVRTILIFLSMVEELLIKVLRKLKYFFISFSLLKGLFLEELDSILWKFFFSLLMELFLRDINYKN